MPSMLETIAADARFITFPVTDGDSSRRPENLKPPPVSAREVNWHRTMTMEEKYACRWRNLIGQGIAKLLEKPDKEKHCLQSFPEGYCMFDHNKGPISNIRHDLYLHGSKTVLRFRSPAEFIPHGYWLLTDPTLNKQNCGCKYCGGGGKKTQTEISESLGLPTNRGTTSVTGATGMRVGGRVFRHSGAAGAFDGPWVARERREERKTDPAWQTTSLNLDIAANSARTSDSKSHRRFRVGELVWCVWGATAPYTARDKEADRDPRFWPAMVVDCCFEALVKHCPPSSTLGYSVHQRRRYAVLRLGAPSLQTRTEYECILDEDEVLPWHAHQFDTSSGAENVRSYGSLDPFTLALHTAHNLVTFWAVCDRLPVRVQSMHSVPAKTKGSQSGSVASSVLSPDPQPIDGHSVPSRFTPFSILYPIDATPPQRSPARLVPQASAARNRISSHAATIQVPASSSASTIGNQVPPQRIHDSRMPQLRGATVTETRYQGLWYGAERIWIGDVVRLCPERDAFAASLRLSLKAQGGESWQQRSTPSPGATMRGVLMRIDRIFACIGEAGTKECAVAGPVYEISSKEWADSKELPKSVTALNLSRSSSGTPSYWDEPDYPWEMTETPPPRGGKRESYPEDVHDIPSFPVPAAPAGYTLRPLLPSGSELPLLVSFIAGRYYPDLLRWSIFDPILSNIPKEVTSLNQLASADTYGLQLLSLCALAPGRFNHAACMDVKLANRTSMLEEAVHMAQAKLRGEGNSDELDIMDVD